MPTRVAIVGVTGYAGGELARLVLRHPEARLVAAVARSHQGEPLRAAQPHLHAAQDSLVIGSDVGDAEVVFTALPAGEAAKQTRGWLDDGRTVIDIGSDFRLRDPKLYERWYGYAHPAPDLLREAVYGLTELTRDRVRTARLIANPGCYPTAALLALAPALKAGLVTEDIIVDAKSGVSGAGHSVEDAYLFGTIDESVRPYGVPKHRHTPEIAQETAALLGKAPRITFTPHLVPMNRGLIASCYAPLQPGKPTGDLVGYSVGAAAAGVRDGKPSRLDVALIVSELPCAAVGVFTTNQVIAAPCVVTRRHLERGPLRAIVVNSGNANACTGEQGERDAIAMAEAAADKIGCDPHEVAVASTGVIGVPLPVERIASAI